MNYLEAIEQLWDRQAGWLKYSLVFVIGIVIGSVV